MARRIRTAATVLLTTLALALTNPLAAHASGATADVMWFNPASGELSTWILDGAGHVLGTRALDWRCDRASGCADQWRPVGGADMTGDGVSDLVWFHEVTGTLSIWHLDRAGHVLGTRTVSWRCAQADCGRQWDLVGLADVDRDGRTDVTWWNGQTGDVSTWLLDTSGTVRGTQALDWRYANGNPYCQGWRPLAVGDLTGEGVADLLWVNNADGALSVWHLDGSGHVLGTRSLGVSPAGSFGCRGASSWLLGLTDVDGNRSTDVVWYAWHAGLVTSWLTNSAGTVVATQPVDWRCDAQSGCAYDWHAVALMH
ncbi:hypothetical protein [Catellatospora bangladeshensis]|uniref:hypothetical protein n=1 Tax=Catellatospora bangladeshensis TaxID=310355 RepID=UPI0019443E3C|nr:hypothetical protein [Catellatospora bangladeshensis]